MRIGIDIDNVITNTDEYLIEKAKLYNSLNNISYRIKENPTSLSLSLIHISEPTRRP